MKRSLVSLLMTVILAVPALAFAQGQTGSLTGVVTDKDGGVIPGATVVVKSNSTGVSRNGVTNASGVFQMPALDPGAYTVTVSLQGFKQVVISNVVVQAAIQASVKATLEIGQLTETVEVKGGSQLVQTQSAAISSTLDVDQIAKLPATTRNALNFITFLPGVETQTTNRGSSIMGLPDAALAITVDGVNVQDNFLKSTDGFFAAVTPRQDAIEQVTVSLATPGAANAGGGAVQIAFVTRSGTNQYKGTAYHYYRDTWMNSNYWFNKRLSLPRNEIRLNQFGASEGGPIVIPGLFDGHGKAFFFFNHEEFHQPTTPNVTRTVANPLTQAGLFQYNVVSGGVTTVRSVDVLALGATNGFPSTPDPTVTRLLAAIRQSTTTTGALVQNTDPNTMAYTWQNPASQVERQPTISVDYNLTPQHRLKGTYNWEKVVRDPDFLNNAGPRFPGFANSRYYGSYRPSASANLRSTLGPTLVNELKGGWSGLNSSFGYGSKPPYETPAMFDDQDGFSLGLGLFTSATTETAPSGRWTPTWNLDESLNWLKGDHSLNFGASYSHVRSRVDAQTLVPSITFGIITGSGGDPADAMFTTGNFNGASTAQLNDARTLYAVLTGRVSAINANARVNQAGNQYVYLGPNSQRNAMDEIGLFAQDQWRVTPTLTANLGVRWQVQLPFKSLNSVYTTVSLKSLCGASGLGSGPHDASCNLFKPGNLPADVETPQFTRYGANNRGYDTYYGNFAPNIGAAWRPNVQGGWLRKLLGDPEQATIRAGYSVAYNRDGVNTFSSVYAANPGDLLTVNRNTNNGNLLPAGESYPILFSQKSRLGPPAFNATPDFPRLAAVGESLNMFDPELRPSFSRSYTVGIQRALGRDMAVEVRYVGTRNVNGWTSENWNSQNIYESGFLNEFKLAQANLRANIASGQGATFAYTGPGTSPLPIYLAAFTGVAPSQAGVLANYQTATAVTNFTNTTFVGRLDLLQPGVTGALNDLWGNAGRRANLLATYPSNQFVMNPAIGSSAANITRSASYTKYDSVQVDLRRRFARGLSASTNYTWQVSHQSTYDDLHFDRYLLRSAGVPWSLKGNWTYELPFGRGRRYATNAGKWLDGFIGGWEWDGTMRVQRRNLVMTGVVLEGMTLDELQNVYKIRIDRSVSPANVYMLPDDIILNTRRAFNTSATTADGYSTALGAPTGRYIRPAGTTTCFFQYNGDCGSTREGLTLRGPLFSRFDFSVKKSFPIRGKVNATLQFDVFNVFDAINFTPVLNPGAGATIFQVTSAYSDTSNTFDPGGRLGQIVWRINW